VVQSCIVQCAPGVPLRCPWCARGVQLPGRPAPEPQAPGGHLQDAFLLPRQQGEGVPGEGVLPRQQGEREAGEEGVQAEGGAAVGGGMGRGGGGEWGGGREGERERKEEG